jgi:hypothetical protein
MLSFEEGRELKLNPLDFNLALLEFVFYSFEFLNNVRNANRSGEGLSADLDNFVIDDED